MAVYTQLSKADISEFLTAYDGIKLQSFKGIAEGVSNTNYLLTTDKGVHYILTLFEDNFNAKDLPFFMRLTEHLAKKDIVCPRPVADRSGEVIGDIKEKPAVLIEFLEGQGNPHITPAHLELVGELVAKLHIAAKDFRGTRKNSLALPELEEIFLGFRGFADKIKPGLTAELENEFWYLQKFLPEKISGDLPAGIIHSDIFPDNVFFMDGNTDQPELSGIIDFYFSCHDFWIYDLLVVLNAWCFDAGHNLVPQRAKALFDAYNKIRPITDAEIAVMPILGRAACMRFIMTRSRDFISRVDGALVNIKDPMEYIVKLNFWQAGGWKYND